jgi:hypothetical protein
LILIPHATCVGDGTCVLQCLKCIWPVLRVAFTYTPSCISRTNHGTLHPTSEDDVCLVLRALFRV